MGVETVAGMAVVWPETAVARWVALVVHASFRSPCSRCQTCSIQKGSRISASHRSAHRPGRCHLQRCTCHRTRLAISAVAVVVTVEVVELDSAKVGVAAAAEVAAEVAAASVDDDNPW